MEITYNKKTINEIIKNLPKTFSKLEKKQYIKNCIEVYNNELHGTNKGLNECIKNTNFNMIKKHIIKN